MKFTGKVADISLNLRGEPKITLTVNEKETFLGGIDDIKDVAVLDVELKKHRKRRSKNANDYLWALCTEIARTQGVSPDEVYRKEIREAGVAAAYACPTTVYERTAIEWSRKGVGWFSVKTDEKDGYTYFLLYYGSSSYNTEEMSRLINATVEDAKALGIETASERELSILRSEWK